MGTTHRRCTQKNHSINTPAKEAEQWWIKLNALVMLHLSAHKKQVGITDQSSPCPQGPEMLKTNQDLQGGSEAKQCFRQQRNTLTHYC